MFLRLSPYTFKIQKLIWADKKSYRCPTTFVSSDNLLSFLNGHFFSRFYKGFCHFLFFLCVFVCPFNGLFAPTSRSPMSKIFRFSESLGKSIAKKWSQIWKLLLIKGVNSPRQKKFFTDFFICSLRLNILFSPLPKIQCPNFL